MSESTNDFLLGGRVKLIQPKEGYRAAIDPVFLAASINPSVEATVLDVGAGTGAASLCLAALNSKLNITGIELQEEMLKIANKNLYNNQFDSSINLIQADISDKSVLKNHNINGNNFDFVITNPPFMAEGMRSPKENKALAHSGEGISLSEWLSFCVKQVKPRGYFSLVHRADKLDKILHVLYKKLGDIKITPLWSKASSNSAKRVIVTGRKGVKTPATLCKGIIVHNEDGSYTDEAESILRNGLKIKTVTNSFM